MPEKLNSVSADRQLEYAQSILLVMNLNVLILHSFVKNAVFGAKLINQIKIG